MPFTVDEFFDVMGRYNDAVWPAQIIFNGLAIGTLFLALRGSHTSRWISGVLAFLWAWMAIAYHLVFFRQINPAANIFAVFFLAEAILLIWCGVIQGRLTFAAPANAWNAAGSALIAFALFVYPLLGLAFGQRYPAFPTFGLPCPTTIFTFGLLMWTRPAAPIAVWIVPFLWAVIGMQAAVAFGVREDFGLPLAALLGLVYCYTQWYATRAHVHTV